MISRHFPLNSEVSRAIAKRLPHAKKNQLSAPGSFFNQFVTDICIYYIYYLVYSTIHINRILIVSIYIYPYYQNDDFWGVGVLAMVPLSSRLIMES